MYCWLGAEGRVNYLDGDNEVFVIELRTVAIMLSPSMESNLLK